MQWRREGGGGGGGEGGQASLAALSMERHFKEDNKSRDVAGKPREAM